MYYDNKSSFYVRQYGPAVIVSVVSLILIGSGVFIYLKSTNMGSPFKKEIAQTVDTNAASTDNKEITSNIETTKEEPVKQEPTVVKEEKPVENNALETEPKVEVPVVKYFENLKALEKSKEVTATNVSAEGAITVEVDGDKVEVTLIGIDFKYSKDAAVAKIKTDLLNKKVKIAFDNLRTENGKTYAYVFTLDSKTSYNAELLKTGLVTLKTERKNTQLNGELASAQAYARQNSLGVWNK